ncbi:MAG: LPXTG cell wall anchor domain-containing protein [Streptococcaceae bacterium]|nr:LPXTG cell wall anchor domain-containing protein [Streptococcaceae bacterium]
MSNKKRRNNKAVFRKFAATAATTTLLVSPLAPAANAIADTINENTEPATEQVVETPAPVEVPEEVELPETPQVEAPVAEVETVTPEVTPETPTLELPQVSTDFVPEEITPSDSEESKNLTGNIIRTFGDSESVLGNVRQTLGLTSGQHTGAAGAWTQWTWTLDGQSIGNPNNNGIRTALAALDAGTTTLVGTNTDGYTVTFNVTINQAEVSVGTKGTVQSKQFDDNKTAEYASLPVFNAGATSIDSIDTEGVFENLEFADKNVGKHTVGRADGQSMVELLNQQNPNFNFTMEDGNLFGDGEITPRVIGEGDLESFVVSKPGQMTKVFDGTTAVTSDTDTDNINPEIYFEINLKTDSDGTTVLPFFTSLNLKDAVTTDNITFGSKNVGEHNAVVNFFAIQDDAVVTAVKTALGSNFEISSEILVTDAWKNFINDNSENFIKGEITPLELTADDLDFDAIGDQLTRVYDGTDTFDKESITVPLKSPEALSAFTTEGVNGITFTWENAEFSSPNVEDAHLIFDGFGYDSKAFGNVAVLLSNDDDVEPNIKIDLEGIEETLSGLSGITPLELTNRLVLADKESVAGQVERKYDGTTDIAETDITGSPIVYFNYPTSLTDTHDSESSRITFGLKMDVPAEYLEFANKNADDNVSVTIDFDRLADDKGLDGILDLIAASNHGNITFAENFGEPTWVSALEEKISYDGTINRRQLGVEQAKVTKTFDGTTDLTADHITGEPVLTGFVGKEDAKVAPAGELAGLAFEESTAGPARVVGDDWTVTAATGTNLDNYILPGELPESIIPATFAAPSLTQSFFTPFEEALNGEEVPTTIAVNELFDGFIESAQGADLVLDGTATQTTISLNAEIDAEEGHIFTDDNGHSHTYILTNAPAVGGVIDPATIVDESDTGEFVGLSAGTTYFAYAVSAYGVNPLTRGGITALSDGSPNFHQGEIATLGTTGEVSTLPGTPAPTPDVDDVNDSDDDTITTGADNVDGPSASGKLPSTGDANGQFAALGAGLLGLSALAAWLKRSRKANK